MTFHSDKFASDRILKKRMLAKERNVEIFEEFLGGTPLIKLTAKYKLSDTRICAIIRSFKILLGYPYEVRNFFLAQPNKHAAWLKKVRGVYLK